MYVNGMESLYPNQMDKDGFLFYPLEAVSSVNKEFPNSLLPNKENIFLFCEYMHRSWWYGVELKGNDNYMIGVLPDAHTFKPIVSSLADFLELYMEDSPVLYDYN